MATLAELTIAVTQLSQDVATLRERVLQLATMIDGVPSRAQVTNSLVLLEETTTDLTTRVTALEGNVTVLQESLLDE